MLKVVREVGYSTGRNTQVGGMGRTGLVGVTTPLIHHSYFSEILAGATEASYEQDLAMVLSPTFHEHDREVSLLERLARGMTDGALLILPEESAAELSALHEQGYPFVIVDPHTPLDENVPTVSANNITGAREATAHLLGLGHRRIGIITGPQGWIATEERLSGYRGALADAGLLSDPSLQIESNFRDNGGYEAALALLRHPDPPTAIFAFNDMMAIGVLHAARDLGLAVPQDLSVVGFDDTFEASIMRPGITTVRQPLAEMGRLAVTQLVRLLHNRRIEALHIQLETKLILRESTAPLRQR